MWRRPERGEDRSSAGLSTGQEAELADWPVGHRASSSFLGIRTAAGGASTSSKM